MLTPNQPEYWNARYLKDNTPWDFGGIPEDLKNFLKKRGKGAKVLIPGCGSGYEIKAFAEAGYEVTAIDFSKFAVERARRMVGPALADNIVVGDFFQYDFSSPNST
ncbi:MAG: methyltransferase domain-containing protein [Lacunisphaera sp.]